MQKLQATGVQFKSFTEQYLDSTGLFREAIIGFLAAIAKQERVYFSERIKAGQARSSKKPGRPTIGHKLATSIEEELAQGTGQRATVRKLGISVALVNRLAQATN